MKVLTPRRHDNVHIELAMNFVPVDEFGKGFEEPENSLGVYFKTGPFNAVVRRRGRAKDVGKEAVDCAKLLHIYVIW